MKSLSKDTVHNAIDLLRNGKSSRNVSRELGISVTSAQRIQKKDKENIPPPKMGSPIKVSETTRRNLARQFDTRILTTLREGQHVVQALEGKQVCTRSIRKYIGMEGLKTYVQQKKPDLTKNQMAARYQFAKDHLKWTVEDWKRVMFSDETIISRVGSYGRKFYYKRPQNKLPGLVSIKRVKQGGGGRMMIWGCITYYGVGDACWIPGKVNSSTYLEVLQDYLLSSRDWFGMDPGTFIFSKTTQRYTQPEL